MSFTWLSDLVEGPLLDIEGLSENLVRVRATPSPDASMICLSFSRRSERPRRPLR